MTGAERLIAAGLGGVGFLVMITLSAAQTLPETSGSLWFYSPGHRSPFNQFPAPAPSRAAQRVHPCPSADHAMLVRSFERPC